MDFHQISFQDKYFFIAHIRTFVLEQSHFPSISDYFYIPIIFDYLHIHCPTVLWQLGQFFFHENNFFSNMVLNSLKAFNYKSLLDRFVVLNKNSMAKKFNARAGARTHDLPVQSWTLYHMSYRGFVIELGKPWSLYSRRYQIMLIFVLFFASAPHSRPDPSKM